jgi:hypothetical protein
MTDDEIRTMMEQDDPNEGQGAFLWGTVCGVFTLVALLVLVTWLAGGAW